MTLAPVSSGPGGIYSPESSADKRLGGVPTPFEAVMAAIRGSQACASEEAEAEPSARLHAQQELAAKVAPRAGDQINLESLRTDVEAALSTWHQEITGRLREAGVELDEPIRLQVASDGRVVVAGDHPQRALIEQTINGDPAMGNAFRAISSTTELLRAADQHREFARAYEQDPIAAVAQYSHLFGESERAVTLLLDDLEAVWEG